MFQIEKSSNVSKGVDNMSIKGGLNTAAEAKGYDEKSVDEVLGGIGNPTFSPIHFIETRKYLQQVRDGKRRIELLEDRIQYRENAGLPTDYLIEELDVEKRRLNLIMAEVAEEISKLRDVGQEMVLTRRYIDGLTWDQVAVVLDMRMRTVQKLHGHALPSLEKILLDDALIEIEGADNADSVLN